MYENDQVANAFKADHAKADRATEVLTLTGHVEIHSNTQHVTMTCDKVEWLKGENLVKATGNVKMFGNFGNVGVAEELWARPELKEFGTPDVFK
jgi:lipopolysaccharide assembly outer membrane protein LptD (OstA)